MKNIVLIIIFSIILLLSVNSSVAVPSTEGSGGPTDIIYSSPISINSALDSGQSVNWDLVEDQSVITDPSKIPPESLKIEQLLPTQINSLTSSQLIYNSNINKLTDWSLLNPSARDSALSQISGNKIKTDATAGKAQKGKVEITSANQVTTPDATLTNAQNLVITNTELEIGSAELIKIKDIVAQGVSNTHFTLSSDSLSITSQPNTFFKFNDLFSAYTYHSLGADNFLRITSGIIEAKNVNLTVTVKGVGKITESVIANGTARMSITKQGIQCLNSTDGFFSIHFSDPKQDFGFRQWTKQNICLRKLASEKVSCNKNCALIDFVDSKITSQGLTDFQRKWLLKKPSHEFHRFFASFDTNAQVTMDFSRDGVTYDLTLSCNNCHTHPNNYYSIYSLNNSTYAWADPTIDKESQSVLRNYQLKNSDAILQVIDQELHYQNNENAITILPPSSQKILQLIKDITSTTPVYLSIPFLLAIPLLSPRFRKALKHCSKAQLTIFFILGIFILIAGSILIGVASIHPVKDYQTTDTQSLVNSCLSDALKDTVVLTARQGGILPLTHPLINDLSAPIITTAPTQEQMLSSMQAPLLQAFESCMTQAKPRNVNVCSGTKTAQLILTQDAITAKLQHCYETRTRTITKTSEATSTIRTNTNTALSNEQSVTERALIVNEQRPINLNSLQGILTFFPYNKILISTQQLSIDNKRAWWVYGLDQ